MNIGQAKEEMKRTVEIYLDTNEYGEYTIPFKRQRPVLLLGAPGIGKRAVIEQIAAEMDIALVSCSLTHYTKQSALGLPYMTKREYGGKTWQVSEYTMSEILLAVYETMEESGRRRGILFLDEIGGVPEALAPALRSLLLDKRIGGKSLPKGWIIAAAGNLVGQGNPAGRGNLAGQVDLAEREDFPGHGNPIRHGAPIALRDKMHQYDIAMLDRLKCLQVEEDLEVWKTYAYAQSFHAAVTAFLDLDPESFYSLYAAGEDWEHVTARGWEDLSGALKMYEKKGFRVDGKMIFQYIGSEKIGGRFGDCYEVFLECREKYPVGDILQGSPSSELAKRAAGAGKEERVVLSHMLLERQNRILAEAVRQEKVRRRVGRLLGDAVRQSGEEGQLPLYAILYAFLEQLKAERHKREAANNLSQSLKEEYFETERLAAGYLEAVRKNGESQGQLAQVKEGLESLERKGRMQAESMKESLERGMSFIEEAWGRGHELESFLHELAANPLGGFFVSCGDAAESGGFSF